MQYGLGSRRRKPLQYVRRTGQPPRRQSLHFRQRLRQPQLLHPVFAGRFHVPFFNTVASRSSSIP